MTLKLAIQERLHDSSHALVDSIFGLEAAVEVLPRYTITPTYYSVAFPGPHGGIGHGHAPGAAFGYRATVGALEVAARSRLVGVVAATATPPFWVQGNRIDLTINVGAPAWNTKLFAWDELFYVSRYVAWSRNRLAFGARKELSKVFAVESYYLHQDDDRSRPGHLDVLGIDFLIELALPRGR